jgi:hypothetical protein
MCPRVTSDERDSAPEATVIHRRSVVTVGEKGSRTTAPCLTSHGQGKGPVTPQPYLFGRSWSFGYLEQSVSVPRTIGILAAGSLQRADGLTAGKRPRGDSSEG